LGSELSEKKFIGRNEFNMKIIQDCECVLKFGGGKGAVSKQNKPE
jgi:hypothetical protein